MFATSSLPHTSNHSFSSLLSLFDDDPSSGAKKNVMMMSSQNLSRNSSFLALKRFGLTGNSNNSHHNTAPPSLSRSNLNNTTSSSSSSSSLASLLVAQDDLLQNAGWNNHNHNHTNTTNTTGKSSNNNSSLNLNWNFNLNHHPSCNSRSSLTSLLSPLLHNDDAAAETTTTTLGNKRNSSFAFPNNSHTVSSSTNNNNNNNLMMRMAPPAARTTNSLLRMTMFDLPSSNNNNKNSTTTTAPTPPIVTTSSDALQDLSLPEILDLSEEIMSSSRSHQHDDDHARPTKRAKTPALVPSSNNNDDDMVVTTPHITSCLPELTISSLPWNEMAAAAAAAQQQQPPLSNDNIHNKQASHKRARTGGDNESSDVFNPQGRFRPYQAGQWADRFQDLLDYRAQHGNCLVPHTYQANLPLARWVKRQRYQYKLMQDGNAASTMTAERVRALADVGFVWDSQGAAWGERLEELKGFFAAQGHCNVPSHYGQNPQLATWVKCQRRQYKLYCEGKASNMTAARIQELEAIGFEWLLRAYKKSTGSPRSGC